MAAKAAGTDIELASIDAPGSAGSPIHRPMDAGDMRMSVKEGFEKQDDEEDEVRISELLRGSMEDV
jgi:hypothetical protein